MPDVTYYFNAYTTPVWADPDYLVDGNPGTFAASGAKKTAQTLTGNNCPGTDLGTILKVELRVCAYGDGDDRLDITPIFTGGNGDTHPTVPAVPPPDWTAYVEITNDTNHPDWSLWSHIQDLDCIINNVAVAKGNAMYASKVEIRVTYTPPPPPTVTTQAVSDIGTTTAIGHGTITETFENCTKRGVCWNTTGNPTVADDKSEETNSFGIGEFSRSMTGLVASTHYYVKGYAYNSLGYGYGNEVEFDTAAPPWEPPVSDIDVGADPIDRTDSYFGLLTLIDKNNPANASGTLHSVKIWAYTNITGLRVGTFYTTNGDTLKCRDSELIGDVEAGAERTFTELSITVVEGDYIGCYFTGGDIEGDLSGFSGVWTMFGEYIDPGDEWTYTLGAECAISLYGYGDIEGPPVGQPYSSRVQGVQGMRTWGGI